MAIATDRRSWTIETRLRKAEIRKRLPFAPEGGEGEQVVKIINLPPPLDSVEEGRFPEIERVRRGAAGRSSLVQGLNRAEEFGAAAPSAGADRASFARPPKRGPG